jgi:hypothetical protein
MTDRSIHLSDGVTNKLTNAQWERGIRLRGPKYLSNGEGAAKHSVKLVARLAAAQQNLEASDREPSGPVACATTSRAADHGEPNSSLESR